jgi:hypothetical protein
MAQGTHDERKVSGGAHNFRGEFMTCAVQHHVIEKTCVAFRLRDRFGNRGQMTRFRFAREHPFAGRTFLPCR